MNALRLDPRLTMLLDRLHEGSRLQENDLATYFSTRAREGSLDWGGLDHDAHRFLSDKLVALERDKAEFCHQLCRALLARRVVEAGTSYGVSTLYLAAAVRANGGGKVIATECEPAKAEWARKHFAEAGLDELVDLREGDLRETLKEIKGPIDFALIDIWGGMALPALERIAPHLRPGAVVVADNTLQFRDAYVGYFEFIQDSANRLQTLTLPFDGGLELTVRV